MGLRRTRSAPTWFSLLLAACAASSPLPRPLAIEPGRRVRVILTDTAKNRTFAIQNESSGARTEVYRDPDAMRPKVVADAQLQQLLDVLAARGMFARAAAAPIAGTRATITVETPEQRFVWSRPLAAPENAAEIGVFEEGRGYVLAVYNSETAYQNGSIEDFDAKTRAEMERARAGGQGKHP